MKLSHRSSFAVAIALGSFALIGGTGLTVSSAWLITMASQHPPILILSVSIVMVRFFGIFRSVARYGERVISHEAIFRKLTGIRVRLFSAFASRLGSSSDISIARQSKAVIDDVERAQEFHLRITLPGISAAIAGAVTILLAAWIEPFLILYVLLLSLLFAIVTPWAVRKFLDPLAIEIEEGENAYAIEIASSSHAMIEADIFGYGDFYRSSLANTAKELRELERRYFARTSLFALLVIGAIGSALVAVGFSLLNSNDLLPIQISMAIFLILVGFEGYTSWFPNLFPAGKIRRASHSIEALSEEEFIEHHLSITPTDVRVSAQNCEANWGEKFLQPFTFEVLPGETLVIEGPSGVGKSTLAAALLGFASYSGSLTIGGVEVRDIENRSELISGTLQHGHIFNTTLRENLKIADESATDEKLFQLLSALEIETISLDEVLGEFGRALSGGEAKRVSIARALLADSPIAILDEPLEHLDSQLAIRIQSAIANLAAGKSLIVITHSPWLQYSRKLTLARE
jgi:ABC-type transport system involved in cytochrome bd biosynthesis fused ATPase/permease subunit